MLISLPLWVSTLILLLPVAVGGSFGYRANAGPDPLTLISALRQLPMLWVALAVAALLPCTLAVMAWDQRLFLVLPLLVQYWGPIILLSLFIASAEFLSFFGVGLAYSKKHPERRKLLFAAVLFWIALGYVLLYYPRPIAAALVHEAATDGSILQSSDASCAPASGANIARALGIDLREPVVAKQMHTTRMFGTSVPQIVVGMQELGINCKTIVSGPENPKLPTPPAFLFVDHWATGQESHVVALISQSDKIYDVVDPLTGREQWNQEKMSAVWHGLAISCVRTLATP